MFSLEDYAAPRRRMNSIPQSFWFATILSKSEVTSSVSRGIDGMSFTQMAAASFVTCYNAIYSVRNNAPGLVLLRINGRILPVSHFIARKFARVSSKVCPNEGSDCSRSTSMIAKLKNNSSVFAILYLIQINRSCDEFFLE